MSLVDPKKLRISRVVHTTPEGEHDAKDCPKTGPWPCTPDPIGELVAERLGRDLEDLNRPTNDGWR